MRRAQALGAGAVLAAALATVLAASAGSGSGTPAPAPERPPGTDVATFAGGCFWCMQAPFDELAGVVSTTVGYTGGHVDHPTYEQVSAGGTGHVEAVQVVYRPEQVSYEKLLDVFWRNVDPLDADGQFCDRGTQYRSAIFVHDDAQRRAAETSKQALAGSGRLPGPVVTEIRPAGAFFPAEDYHQDYYRKNPLRYRYYRHGCGRDRRLEQLWGTDATH